MDLLCLIIAHEILNFYNFLIEILLMENYREDNYYLLKINKFIEKYHLLILFYILLFFIIIKKDFIIFLKYLMLHPQKYNPFLEY